jgi:hypothetical protein
VASSKIRMRGLRDQRAGDGDALALAAGQGRAVFADHGVVAFRQFQDEVVRAGQLRRPHHLLQRRARIGQRDVVADAAVEQHVLLQHHADLAAQRGGVGQRQIDAIHQHAAALRHVEALHQLGQRALAGAGAADDADHLARPMVRLTPRSTSGPSGR